MARIKSDADRANLLRSLLDQAAPDDYDNVPEGPQVARMPIAGTRSGEQANTINKMSSPIDPQTDDDYERISDPDDPEMIQRKPDQGTPADPRMNQAMIPVPASLAHAGMQALMQQASANSIGRARGSDGSDMRGGMPRIPGDLEGGEVEADEAVGHNRGPEFPTDEFDNDRTLNQMRKRVSPERRPARRG
jgi:hypothetical protein